MNMVALSPDNSSESMLNAWHALQIAIHSADSPDTAPPSLISTTSELQPELDRRESWLYFSGEQAVGGLIIKFFKRANSHHVDFTGYVHPGFRGQGIGRFLFQYAIQRAQADNRITLATRARLGSESANFFETMGMTLELVEVRNVLHTSKINREQLTKYASGEASDTDDIELVRWINHCPEELLDACVAVTSSWNDIPMGGIAWKDNHFTPERIREWEAAAARHQKRLYVMALRNTKTGELAGITDISAPCDGSRADIGYTAILRQYRGRALSLWLKAELTLWLMEKEPQILEHSTTNAHTNAPMLTTNAKLGYKPVENIGWWQIRLD